MKNLNYSNDFYTFVSNLRVSVSIYFSIILVFCVHFG